MSSAFPRTCLVMASMCSILSCIEPFNPPGLEKYDDILVIDGRLTNEIPAARITISRSFRYDQNVTRPVDDALVQVMDESGTTFTLTNSLKGNYLSDSAFIPRQGQMYMIRITDAKGDVYESDYETMLPAPVLDSVYFMEMYNNPEHPYDGEEGVEIHASMHSETGTSGYFEWKWDETWEIVPPVNMNGFRPCWQSMKSSAISISTTENLTENRIPDTYLYFVPSRMTPKLSVRYNGRIKISSLTRDHYTYLRKLKEINSGAGGFFDPVPGALYGNIHKVGEENAPVIGLFTASAIDARVIVISRRDLKIRYIETGFTDCVVEVIKWPEPYTLPMFGSMYVAGQDGEDLVLVNIQKCYDCSYVGSPLQPEDWQ